MQAAVKVLTAMQVLTEGYNKGVLLTCEGFERLRLNNSMIQNALQKKLNSQNMTASDLAIAEAVDAAALARAFVSLIPNMMGSLRRHLRTAEGGDLRVGQFRMMMAIAMESELSISNAAAVMGLTLPSASKVADELAREGLIQRREDRHDRRRSLLSLTPAGVVVLRSVQQAAEDHFAAVFSPLTPAERAFLRCAAETLRPLFRCSGRGDTELNGKIKKACTDIRERKGSGV